MLHLLIELRVLVYTDGTMISSVSGTLLRKTEHAAVIQVGGVAFRIFVGPRTLSMLPKTGAEARLFTYLHVRENALELYGFLSEAESDLFERLNTVSGVGPKSALGVMGVAPVNQLSAAINEGRAELLTRASGIGRKTAERIILDLKGKLGSFAPAEALGLMESGLELEETLIALGFSKAEAKAAAGSVSPTTKGFAERLKEALRGRKRGGSVEQGGGSTGA